MRWDGEQPEARQADQGLLAGGVGGWSSHHTHPGTTRPRDKHRSLHTLPASDFLYSIGRVQKCALAL